MKLYARLCSLLLAVSLLFSLAACSDNSNINQPSVEDVLTDSPADDAAGSTDDSSSSSVLPDDFVVDTSVEDVCLATLGVPGEFALFTVNGEPVTAYSYLYWLTDCIDYLASYMSYYGLTLDLRTDATFADYARDSALSSSTQYSIIESKAKELGYELTEEQASDLAAYLALSAEYMGGEEAFREELRKGGLDYDSFYAINAASYYYAQLKDGLFSTPPSDEDMDSYIEENDILSAKHILLMTIDPNTYEPLDDETIAQKSATAKDILSQLQNSTDLETDFDALMHEYSEDTGLTSNPNGYTFTAGEMVTEFETATRALEYGQFSGIVESPYGYHIILRLDPDTEDARADYLDTRMSKQIETWVSEADLVLTNEYNAIDVALFYEKYVAYQEAFAAEDAALQES